MTSRERFEAWAKSEGYRDVRPDTDCSWRYPTDEIESAWAAWQAAEKQALERAAMKCEEVCHRANKIGLIPQADTAAALAMNIRALIDAQKEGEK
jgi:hypothetical protein